MEIDFFASLSNKRASEQQLVAPPLSKKNHIEVSQLNVAPSKPSEPKDELPHLFVTKESDHNCIWQRYSTEDSPMVVPQRAPAKAYKFQLDNFQKRSVRCIEAGESVLVCAHTSAGKTAVAEYAISMSLKGQGRVIYTSPIKALSNQKFRDLTAEYGDVGLVTGDVTQNPSSGCLVMTTEILRSMIYRGSEVVREVKWVIFDQCHYMRDAERGVVWEECIEMLPKAVKLLFLSATIANAAQFARWVCTIKSQPCSVIYTDYRPVPLEHYIFPAGADGISLVVDEKGRFLEDNFQRAIEGLGEAVPVIGLEKKGRKMGEGSDLQKIIKLLVEKEFDPVIVFSFSKKDVEGFAQSLHQFDFLREQEKEKVAEIFKSAVAVLSEEDRKLPQIQTMRPILERGIGIHHGGLLPIVKEAIEILFQESLIKVLFSTETFSMGLNMPARTVVFTSIRKFDGADFRWMRGGEYIQMSGRAGRRGKDKRGVSVVMLDEKLEPQVAREVLRGKSDPLESAFHVNYNMLLNSIRLEDIDPEYILRHSFLQFQTKARVPQLREKKARLEQESAAIVVAEADTVASLFELEQFSQRVRAELRGLVCKPELLLEYMRIGRLAHVQHREVDWGWGVIVNWSSRKASRRKGEEERKQYIVDILVHVQKLKTGVDPRPAALHQPGEILVIPFVFEALFELSLLVIKLPENITAPESKVLVKETLKEIHRQNPVLPVLEVKEESGAAARLYQSLRESSAKMVQLRRQLGATAGEQLGKLEQKLRLGRQMQLIEEQMEDSFKLVLADQMQSMERVLRRMEMLDEAKIVTMKGAVACEIGSCDEILLTELLFSGFFSDYSPAEVAAILSSIVHDEKSPTDRKFIKTPSLEKGVAKLRAVSKEVFKVLSQCRIEIDEEQYEERIKETLVEVTLEWCRGASFLTVCKLTDAYEGSIIRTIKRLDELLKQLVKGAAIMGNAALESKFKEACGLLERGIIFAASLYL